MQEFNGNDKMPSYDDLDDLLRKEGANFLADSLKDARKQFMSNSEQPRFLLDDDSVCYGCGYYIDIAETEARDGISEDDIDENGGFCNCSEPCLGGEMNGYRSIYERTDLMNYYHKGE